MAGSTGPILAIGGITMLNQSVFNNKPPDLRVAVATGLAAGVFALAENAGGGDLVVKLAWLALIAVSLTRVDPNMPAPAESALRWWEGTRK
jgi:hypothetical protein